MAMARAFSPIRICHTRIVVLAFWGLVLGITAAQFSGPAQAQCTFQGDVKDTDKRQYHSDFLKYCQDGSAVRSEIEVWNEDVTSKLENLTTQPSPGGRVRNGFPAIEQIRKIMVRIDFKRNDGGHEICSGVMISASAIMTAAHCSCGAAQSYVVQFQKGARLNVGSVERYAMQPELSRFPGYDCNKSASLQAGLDLAILYFEPGDVEKIADGEIRNPPGIWPVFDFGTRRPNLTVAGFGVLEDGSIPDHLRMALVSMVDPYCVTGVVGRSVCKMFREFALSNLIQTGGALDADTCGGDSGGGVFYLVQGFRDDGTPGDLIPKLVGITSRAIAGVNQDNRLFCGGGGIYTAVGTATILDWLNSLGVRYALR